MDKNNRIIVSVIGILLVALGLIGLTYEYFLTRIKGNTNTKSIDITTADLKLEYKDGVTEILAKKNIKPGDVIGSKDFTVTNIGETKIKGYVVYLEDVVNTFKYSNDVVYTLTCNSSDNNVCNGLSETIYPISNKILVTNDIEPHVVQSYVLSINYKETKTDQSDDMNKKLGGKINIYDAKSINPYSDKVSLVYNIINNASQNKNGTSLVGSPLTSIANEVSDEKESELSITKDDYGISYYYRGNVKNNYVNYSGKCFRIVRIEGDGSVKLVLSSDVGECSKDNFNDNSAFYGTGDYGIKTENIEGTNVVKSNYSSESNTSMKYNFDQYLSLLNTSKIKTDSWCLNDSSTKYNVTTGELLSDTEYNTMLNNSSLAYSYKASILLNGIGKTKTASLKCNGTNVESKIGALTADEIAFAGISFGSENHSYYLLENAKDSFRTLTISGFNNNTDTNYVVSENGKFIEESVNTNIKFRPSITLVPGVKISDGNGTINAPYIIDMNN